MGKKVSAGTGDLTKKRRMRKIRRDIAEEVEKIDVKDANQLQEVAPKIAKILDDPVISDQRKKLFKLIAVDGRTNDEAASEMSTPKKELIKQKSGLVRKIPPLRPFLRTSQRGRSLSGLNRGRKPKLSDKEVNKMIKEADRIIKLAREGSDRFDKEFSQIQVDVTREDLKKAADKIREKKREHEEI